MTEKEKVKLNYNLPVPPDGRKTDTVGVLTTPPAQTDDTPLPTQPEPTFNWWLVIGIVAGCIIIALIVWQIARRTG